MENLKFHFKFQNFLHDMIRSMAKQPNLPTAIVEEFSTIFFPASIHRRRHSWISHNFDFECMNNSANGHKDKTLKNNRKLFLYNRMDCFDSSNLDWTSSRLEIETLLRESRKDEKN